MSRKVRCGQKCYKSRNHYIVLNTGAAAIGIAFLYGKFPDIAKFCPEFVVIYWMILHIVHREYEPIADLNYHCKVHKI